MAETLVKTPWGQVKVSHPQGATDDEILAYAKNNARPPQVMEDTIRSVAAAPRKAMEGMAGLPGTIGNAMQAGVNKVMDVATGKPLADIYGGEQNIPGFKLPTAETIQGQTSKVLGPSYQPQTPQGQIAGAVTEGATGGLIGKGPMLAKLLTGGMAGAGGEVGGMMTSPDSIWHVPAVVGGSILGGGIATAGERGFRGVRNYSTGNNVGQQIGQLTGDGPVSSGSVRRLGNAVEADNLTPTGVQSTLQALGPEARMLDVGRQLEQLGVVGLSRIPGQAQSQILNMVEGRTGKLLPTGKYEPGANSAVRLREDFDTAMGPSHDLVQLQKGLYDRFHPKTQAAYKKVMGEYDDIGIPDSIKGRDAIETAMQGAEKLASNYGATPKRGSLEYWDYVKKGLDRRINGLIKTGTDSQGQADLGGLLQAKRDLVAYLDNATTTADGVSQYARARKLSATEKGLQEASEFGPTMFNNKILPEVAKQQYDDLSIAEKAVAKASIRRELERQMGSTGNDAAKAKAIFGQNNVLDKARAIFGDDAADLIKSSVDREHAFQATTNTATKQSITNTARNVTDELRDQPQNLQVPTAYGALTSLPRQGMQYLHGAGMERTRNDLARVLLQQHPEVGPSQIPKIIELLQGYNQKVAANQATPLSQQAQIMARALMAQTGQ